MEATNSAQQSSCFHVLRSDPSTVPDPFRAALGYLKANNQTNIFFLYYKCAFHLFISKFVSASSLKHIYSWSKKKKEERSILDVAMETEMVVRILELKPDVWRLLLLRRDDQHPEPGHNAVVRNFDYYPAWLCSSPACPHHAEWCVIMKRGRRETILILSARETNFKIT